MGPGVRRDDEGVFPHCQTAIPSAVIASAAKQSISQHVRKHGLLRCARNDVGNVGLMYLQQRDDVTPHSRGMIRPRFAKTSALANEEGAGKTGCTLHPRSRVQTCTKKRTRAYRFSGGIRPSLRNGFTAYNALSPATGFLATVASRISPRSLTPASGRQDHTTSPSASACVRLSQAPRPPHPTARFVTCATPLSSGETAQAGSADLPDGESEIFLCEGLDRFW